MSDISGFDRIGEFQQRLTALLQELQGGRARDPEVIHLVGSLAASLTRKANLKNWPAVKAALAPEAYSSLLQTFQRDGNTLASAGKDKAVFAVQVMSLSLVGSRLDDLTVRDGTALLDEFIGQTMQTVLTRAKRRRQKPPLTQ